jgi:uncharacterized protein YkwD
LFAATFFMQGVPLSARFLTTAAVLVLAFFSRAEAQQTHASSSDTRGPDFRAQVEKETFIFVNQYRKESDLPALKWSDAIAREARAHSKDMATGEVDFGHEGFNDRVGHIKDVMSGIWSAGENVLFTSNLDSVARTAVTLWLHSPHHLKNIRGDYNYSGLGVWQDKNGVIYFTQIFVNVKPPEQESAASSQSGVISPFGFLAPPETRKAR